ncbi:hypothetical protein PGR6_05150 [Pseudomonas sp. GR 6-02]|jgi:hypothetical protein|nr:hypothetical protein PGR6_05150 [Pseudomonas sp. GR 6-02]
MKREISGYDSPSKALYRHREADLNAAGKIFQVFLMTGVYS